MHIRRSCPRAEGWPIILSFQRGGLEGVDCWGQPSSSNSLRGRFVAVTVRMRWTMLIDERQNLAKLKLQVFWCIWKTHCLLNLLIEIIIIIR